MAGVSFIEARAAAKSSGEVDRKSRGGTGKGGSGGRAEAEEEEEEDDAGPVFVVDGEGAVRTRGSIETLLPSTAAGGGAALRGTGGGGGGRLPAGSIAASGALLARASASFALQRVRAGGAITIDAAATSFVEITDDRADALNVVTILFGGAGDEPSSSSGEAHGEAGGGGSSADGGATPTEGQLPRPYPRRR